ncbi:MAG: putative porin [Bacteroides sp.]|nr:putative porin [Bacteroides sp.]
MNVKSYIFLIIMMLAAFGASAQEKLTRSGSEPKQSAAATESAMQWDEAITRITSWNVSEFLGDRSLREVDTLMENYCQEVAIPSLQFGYASAITGNYGAEGTTMNYFERPLPGGFFFSDALAPYIPTVEGTPFYNSRVPMTLLSYNFGYGTQQAQDRLKAVFNGNINRRAQVGGNAEYILSKGSYENQADKHFNFGLNGSYFGDHYQVMAMFNQYYSLNKENGGIQNDLYITDPAEMQGGNSKITSKNIPVNLRNAHSRVNGREFWMNNRYRFGFKRFNEEDSTETFIPVSQVFWTFDFNEHHHQFRTKSAEDHTFWANNYFDDQNTDDDARALTVRNTVGLSLLEGFNRWAKFGLSAYVQHEFNRYRQLQDYDPLGIRRITKEHSLYLGGRLSKEQGSLLRYDAHARIGIAGQNIGEVEAGGEAQFRVKIRRDTASIRAFAEFTNLNPSFFVDELVSNHFIWKNDFGMTRRLRFGGEIDIPQTWTNLSAGMENVQNLIYFGSEALPIQHGGNIQVFSATLNQGLHLGIFNWDNAITYQAASNTDVLRLPALSVFSNMYLLFRVATLRVQFGVDCNYMTSYKAQAYQPATMTFHNQDEIRVGNYPMMDAYLNMKLSKVRFYVLCSHFNQGLFGGSNYFSAAHYPLNPRRFMFGLSIDFAN